MDSIIYSNCQRKNIHRISGQIQLMASLLLGLIVIFGFTINGMAQGNSSLNINEQIKGWEKILLESNDENKQIDAVQNISQRSDKKSSKPLIKALQLANPKVTEQVILAIGQLRLKEGVSPLLKFLENNSDLRFQAAAAFSLGLIRDKRAVERLIGKLNTPDETLKRNIVVALGLLGDPRAVEPLLSMPHDDEHKTCAPIAIALGQIKRDVSSDKLFNWLNSDEADVCQNAAVALVLIGGKKQLTPLLQVLKNTNPVSRRGAAFALGSLKDKRAVTALIELLSDPDTQVRLNVIEALALIKDKRAIDWLERTAETDNLPAVRERAEEAIKRIRGDTN